MKLTAKTHGPLASLALGLVCLAAPGTLPAASPVVLAGSISGYVTDSSGVPQMGAAVLLFNRYDRLSQKILTNENGLFSFAGLIPDIYSIRVTLASFVPAIKSRILVQPGVRSVLNVSLANLFSSIQLVYPSTDQHVFMNDEWKWVLRTSSENRPVLRFLPGFGTQRASRAAIFSDTRGLLRVSAGDGDPATGAGNTGDLGTAFALATSLYGNNLLHFSGKVGYGAMTGAPSTAFRTSFTRNVGQGSPEVSLTMRTLYLPGRAGMAIAGGEGGLPALRSMSVNFEDRAQLSGDLQLQYGFSMDSVTFLDRLNYFSPFARLSYSVGRSGTLEFAYTSGNARPDLAGRSGAPGQELQRDLSSLGLMPRISRIDGRAKVQRGEDFELSYTRAMGSRSVSVGAYRESVRNAALTMSDPDGLYDGTGDLLPDLFSGNEVFNAGNYHSVGYSASLTQNLGDHFSATLIYGSLGALTVDDRELETNNPDELRRMIRAGRRHAATARVSATLPATGTHVVTSYQWTDNRTLTPGHLYSTQTVRPEPGFNLFVRQPIPTSIFPWRMEISADLRNLLAQGYLPLASPGRRVLLMQTPRAFRGGLSFIF